MLEFILCEKRDAVGILTLNRPKKYNSFNREMALQLQELLRELDGDSQVRAILITGEGKAFSAGQDLNEVVDENNGISLEKILSEHYNPLIKIMRSCETPIITAVNGVAAGAGANIAMAGDIIVASEKASFLQAFCHIGLIPDSGGTFMLPRLVGWQKASALMLLGEKISAREAERIGIVYQVFSEDEFAKEIQQMAKKLAALPTTSLGYIKKALNASLENTLEEQLEYEEKYQIKAAHTSDYKEGVAAFLEKRKAKFTGK